MRGTALDPKARIPTRGGMPRRAVAERATKSQPPPSETAEMARAEAPAEPSTTRGGEAVGVFEGISDLQSAADEFLRSGFDRAQLSMSAPVAAPFDASAGSLRDRADDPALPRGDYLPPEAIGEAKGALTATGLGIPALFAAGAVGLSGGTTGEAILTTVLAGAVGGLLGWLAGSWVERRHLRNLRAQCSRGGLILWVRTWTAAQERRAQDILSRHGACDVHVRDI